MPADRIILSSAWVGTFRDFIEERDLLVKQVFPELRRKARERGVEVVDVDLRWGITEEKSRQGKEIPICLGKIDRCRPISWGMLGESNGELKKGIARRFIRDARNGDHLRKETGGVAGLVDASRANKFQELSRQECNRAQQRS